MESMQCGGSGEWQEGSMCQERKEAEPDHIGPVGHGRKIAFSLKTTGTEKTAWNYFVMSANLRGTSV